MNTRSPLYTCISPPSKSRLLPKDFESPLTVSTSLPVSHSGVNFTRILAIVGSGTTSSAFLRSSILRLLSAVMKFLSLPNERCCSIMPSMRFISSS